MQSPNPNWLSGYFSCQNQEVCVKGSTSLNTSISGWLISIQGVVMKSRLLVILPIAAFLIVSVVAGGFQDNSRSTADRNSRPEVDFSHFPIVEFNSPELSDPALRTRRANKSRKYNKKSQPRISELTDVTFVANEELGKLPALPVERSSVILVGEIISAKAYL